MKIVLNEEDKNKRLDVIACEKFSLSRNNAKKLIEDGKITVNSVVQSPSYKIKNNDEIELSNTFEEPYKIKPKNIPLDILYEDNDLIILNKQKDLICHPTSRREENTLVSALLYHTKNLSDISGYERQGIVHRLDKDTSGLMLIAKNNKAHEFLQKDIQIKKTIRKYLAICHGVIDNDFGKIEKPLVHYLGKTVKMHVSDKGQEAVTNFKVLERFEGATFLELQLETGRTHQIRCHLASLNHPIIGDELYGAKGFNLKVLKGFKPKGQILMSYYLSFTHPSTGEIMEFEIKKDNYHPDLKKALSLLRS